MKVVALHKLEKQQWIAQRGDRQTFKLINGRDDFTFVWRISPYSHITMISHFTHENRNFIGYDTIENRDEMPLPTRQVLIIVNEKSNVNVPYRTIEKFATTYQLFCDTLFGSEIFLFGAVSASLISTITNYGISRDIGAQGGHARHHSGRIIKPSISSICRGQRPESHPKNEPF